MDFANYTIFEKNDVLFYRKRYVVLLKMTRCFIENDTLFF